MPKYNKSLKLKPGSKPSSLQMSKQTETENEDLQERGVQAYHVIFVNTRSLRYQSIKTKKFKTCTRTEKLKLFVKNQIKQSSRHYG